MDDLKILVPITEIVASRRVARPVTSCLAER